MRVVRMPNEARCYFSHDQLSGWPTGIQFTPGVISYNDRGKKKLKTIEVREPVVPVQMFVQTILK